jgi:hypothetical protein
MIGVTLVGIFLTPVFYSVVRRLSDHKVRFTDGAKAGCEGCHDPAPGP